MSLNLEEHPTQEQRRRLEDFLTELTIISRRYNILMVATQDTRLNDVNTHTVIGLDLFWMFDQLPPPSTDQPYRLSGRYMAGDSILDGVWLVDDHGYEREAREVGPILGERDEPPR